jgi:hypothetical protein
MFSKVGQRQNGEAECTDVSYICQTVISNAMQTDKCYSYFRKSTKSCELRTKNGFLADIKWAITYFSKCVAT